MNDEELKCLDDKCKESGQTRQSFIFNAIDGAEIATSDQIKIFKELSVLMADYMRQLRGIAININQQARYTNEIQHPVEKNILEKQYEEIESLRREGEKVWQLLRQLISRQKLQGP